MSCNLVLTRERMVTPIFTIGRFLRSSYTLVKIFLELQFNACPRAEMLISKITTIEF